MTTAHRTTCAHCAQPLTQSQQWQRQTYCSRACRYATSLTARARSLDIPVDRVRTAKAQGRLVDRGDQLFTTARRCCVECGSRRNLRGSSRLCGPCLTLGYRWCTYGKHVCTVVAFVALNALCLECRNAERSAYGRAQTIARYGIPPGWVRIRVAADRMHYSVEAVFKAIKRGWMQGKCGKFGGRWYIEDRDVYPGWEGL